MPQHTNHHGTVTSPPDPQVRPFVERETANKADTDKAMVPPEARPTHRRVVPRDYVTPYQEPHVRVPSAPPLGVDARVDQIWEIASRRGITTLVHFTRLENVASILTYGILSRGHLETWSVERRPLFNDDSRLDRRRNASCLSVGFPNYKLFYRWGTQHQAEWIIILVDAAVMWELDCAFCAENAASGAMRATLLGNLQRPQALEDMFFHEEDWLVQEEQGIPDDYPADPQAEVLVFSPIPPSYFQAIHVYSHAARLALLRDCDQLNLPCEVVVSREYYAPRQDWQLWQ